MSQGSLDRSLRNRSITKDMATRMAMALLLLLVPPVSFSQGRATDETPLQKAYMAVLPSVIQIRVTANCQGEMKSSLGTGFLISAKAHVVTARHILLPDCEIDLGNSFVLLSSGRVGKVSTGFTGVPFRILRQDDTKDLAVLILKENPFQGEVHTGTFSTGEDGVRREVPVRYGVAPIDDGDQPVGTPVIITGYALNDSAEVTSTGKLATGWQFRTPPDRPVPGLTSTVFYLANLRVGLGDSGAPVYSLETGKVIGICIGHLLEPVVRQMESGEFESFTIEGSGVYSNAGLAVVVPMRYALALLQEIEEEQGVQR